MKSLRPVPRFCALPLFLAVVASLLVTSLFMPTLASAQGLVEGILAMSSLMRCPGQDGCRLRVAIANRSDSIFTAKQFAIGIGPDLGDNKFVIPTTPDPSFPTTVLVCTVTTDLKVRVPIEVPPGELGVVDIKVPALSSVYARVVGERLSAKQAPMLCWSATDAVNGAQLAHDCADFSQTLRVAPLVATLQEPDLCEEYESMGGPCVCPYD
jgi:hypothetical protein